MTDIGEIAEILYLVIGAIGMVSNGIVLVVIGSSCALRQKLTNKYFLNQSALDFFASLSLILTGVNVDPDYTKPGGQFVCKFWTSDVLLWSVLMSSTYNLVATSVDRYLQVVHPLWHKKTMSKTKSRLIFLLVWLSGFIWNVPMIVATSGVIDGTCFTVSFWPSIQLQHAIGILGIMLQFFVPIGILVFAYVRILKVLKSTNGNARGTARSSTRGQQNVIKTLLSVTIVFVVCWCPNEILFLYYNFGGEINFQGVVYHVTVVMVFSNSCINPFVYLIKYKQCRHAMIRMCARNKVFAHSTDASETGTRNQVSTLSGSQVVTFRQA